MKVAGRTGVGIRPLRMDAQVVELEDVPDGDE